MSSQPPSARQHPDPPRFRRCDEAYNWLADHGWRQVGEMRGSHIRLEHPAYGHPLFLIYRRGALWGEHERMQLRASLRRLDREWRRAEATEATEMADEQGAGHE